MAGDVVRARHSHVMRLVSAHLGDYIAPATKFNLNESLDQFVRSNKRLIIGYNGGPHFKHPAVFPPVKHIWGNSDTIDKLKSFFDASVCDASNSGQLRSAQAALTASTPGILCKFIESIKL